MPKLWIVHRNPNQRAALARLAGLAAGDVEAGPPRAEAFESSSAPAAVMLGLEDDFELELEFAHRMGPRLPGVSWILLCERSDADEAARLFDTIEPDLLERLPTARILRARIAAAMARRSAASLAERRQRSRIAERFSAWLGGVEVHGLLRALDPSLASLPLLVRGVPGSGRTLLCRYVEIFRGGDRPSIRVHAGEITEAEELAQRLTAVEPPPSRGRLSIWIDEVDRLPPPVQHALAEWILHGLPPGPVGPLGEEPPRWIATAGPACWQDPLEPALQRAFSPLDIEVPSLAAHPETIPGFAEEVARDWARSVGGVPRRFAPSALAAIEAQAWEGDRAQVESVLRATLAASRADPIEAEDLERAGFPAFESSPLESSREASIDDSTEAIREEVGEEILEEASGAASTERAPEARPFEPESGGPIEEAGLDESTFLSEASFALTEMDDAETGAGPDALQAIFESGHASGPEADREPEAAAAGTDRSPGEPSRPAERAPTPPPAGTEGIQGWRRLARSLSHEIRNPLVSIRTFAELLPDHYADETFRQRFVELVGQDVAHIGEVIARLSSVAEQEKAEAEAFDVSAMIEGLLEERREQIQRRRLLVLRELERDAPLAWADPTAMRVALAGLLDRALSSLPERGDLFVATRHVAREAEDASRLRILLRHHGPDQAGEGSSELEELSPAANVLEYVLAQTVVESSGGSLTLDSTDAQETLVLVDLRTPL